MLYSLSNEYSMNEYSMSNEYKLTYSHCEYTITVLIRLMNDSFVDLSAFMQASILSTPSL